MKGAAAKRAAKAATKKTSAKAAAKKTSAKTAEAATRAAAKKTAKAATPGAGKAAAKKATKAAGSSGKAAPVVSGPLADWVARFRSMVSTLESDPRAHVLASWEGPRMVPGLIKEVEKRIGGPLDPAIGNVYLQVNGFGVVWVPKGREVGVRLSRRKRPSMMDLEGLPPGAGVIAVMPIHEVFGLGRRPFFDYAQFMPGEPPHWGFDFPGNFYTPAFVQTSQGLMVKVGDDHGASWDAPAVTFERYMENVLATWGGVAARARVFIKGKGKPVKEESLTQALAAALSA